MDAELVELQMAVAGWRSRKSFPTEKMPKELESRILALRGKMKASEIIRSLKLSADFFTTRSRQIKRKISTKRKTDSPMESLVRLPSPPVKLENKVLMTFRLESGLEIRVYR